jgi:hypothetical protein
MGPAIRHGPKQLLKKKKKKILCLSKKNPEKQSNRFYGHQHIEDERRERIYIFLRFTELYIP